MSKRSASLCFELDPRPLERLSADVAVAGIFGDDRPLRGGAGRLDWRLCGLVSELLLAGEMKGEAGEAVLIPSWPNLRAPRILLLGLGERASYRMVNAEDATRDAISRVLALGVEHVAMAPLGIAADDLPRHAPALIGGAKEALNGLDRSLRVCLTVPVTELERSARAMEVAVRAIGSPTLSVAPRRRQRELEDSIAGALPPVGGG